MEVDFQLIRENERLIRELEDLNHLLNSAFSTLKIRGNFGKEEVEGFKEMDLAKKLNNYIKLTIYTGGR